MNKQELREKMKIKRSALSKEFADEKSKTICKRFSETDVYKKSHFIAAYMSIKNEVDLKSLIDRAFADGKRVCIPVTDTKTNNMFLSEIFKDDDFESGAFGIKEPKIKRRTDAKSVDLMLVPGLAFDFSGGRIGWGKGYYDRLIPQVSSVLVGIGYEFQLCGAVETQEHDCKMDYILTESEMVVCG